MGATWINSTTSGVISKVRSQLYSLTITPDGSSKNADCTLYNGENTTEERIMQIYSGTGTTYQVIFNPPLLCNRGIYLLAGSHVGQILIQYDVIKE